MTEGLVSDGPVREDWRWFDAAPLDALAASPRGAAPDISGRWIEAPGPRLLFVDGVFQPEASTPGEVKVSAARYHTRSSLYSGQASDSAQAGYVIALGAGHAMGGLVQIVHATTGGVAHLSNRIMLARDAQASIVETQVGPGWSNASTVIELHEGARLMRALRVTKDRGAHTDTIFGWAGRAASLTSVALVTGCRTARLHNEISLTGEGAFAELSGALLTRGDESVDAFNVIDHAMPDGTSRQVWRAVAADQSTASMASRVQVRRDAQKSDGEQSLRGLLLKRTATVNLKPELEIFADDVKCAHGATVGELDKRALFYLESRGIPEPRAKALLTRAFVADALARIGDEAVRAAFEADADGWLEASL